MPAEIKDAATSTLALLRTATVIRLEGGEVWAWEGQHTQDGSCEGSCTHVWNYQQALSHLFPALERTLALREPDPVPELDPLTQLYDRRSFNALLDREIHRARAAGRRE